MKKKQMALWVPLALHMNDGPDVFTPMNGSWRGCYRAALVRGCNRLIIRKICILLQAIWAGGFRLKC